MGSVASQQILRAGHEVRVLDSLLHGGQGLMSLYPNVGFEFIHGDVRSPQLIDQATDGVDAVVHLAAIVGDPACARDPDLSWEVNFEAAMQTFEASRRNGAGKFIFASTCSNYGRQADPNQFASEESELSPLSVYAESKVAVEQSLLDMSGNNYPAVTVLRFATLFGLSPRMRFDLTVNEFTLELLEKSRLEIFGEQHWRPYIHVADAARAIVRVLDAPEEKVSGQVFNAGDTGQNFKKGEIVDLICAQLDQDVDIQRVHKEEDPRDYRVSFDKIKRELNFEITRTVKDGIREIVGAIHQGVIEDLGNPRYRN
jgi:nucleoside-diphosphate-sugar epimerase